MACTSRKLPIHCLLAIHKNNLNPTMYKKHEAQHVAKMWLRKYLTPQGLSDKFHFTCCSNFSTGKKPRVSPRRPQNMLKTSHHYRAWIELLHHFSPLLPLSLAH